MRNEMKLRYRCTYNYAGVQNDNDQILRYIIKTSSHGMENGHILYHSVLLQVRKARVGFVHNK